MTDTYVMLSHLAQTGVLIYFAAIFAGVVVYALSPSRKQRFDEAARLPLSED